MGLFPVIDSTASDTSLHFYNVSHVSHVSQISQMAQLKPNIYRIGKTDRFGCEGCNITADRWAIENHVCSGSRIENNFHQGINTLESYFI